MAQRAGEINPLNSMKAQPCNHLNEEASSDSDSDSVTEFRQSLAQWEASAIEITNQKAMQTPTRTPTPTPTPRRQTRSITTTMARNKKLAKSSPSPNSALKTPVSRKNQNEAEEATSSPSPTQSPTLSFLLTICTRARKVLSLFGIIISTVWAGPLKWLLGWIAGILIAFGIIFAASWCLLAQSGLVETQIPIHQFVIAPIINSVTSGLQTSVCCWIPYNIPLICNAQPRNNAASSRSSHEIITDELIIDPSMTIQDLAWLYIRAGPRSDIALCANDMTYEIASAATALRGLVNSGPLEDLYIRIPSHEQSVPLDSLLEHLQRFRHSVDVLFVSTNTFSTHVNQLINEIAGLYMYTIDQLKKIDELGASTPFKTKHLKVQYLRLIDQLTETITRLGEALEEVTSEQIVVMTYLSNLSPAIDNAKQAVSDDWQREYDRVQEYNKEKWWSLLPTWLGGYFLDALPPRPDVYLEPLRAAHSYVKVMSEEVAPRGFYWSLWQLKKDLTLIKTLIHNARIHQGDFTLKPHLQTLRKHALHFQDELLKPEGVFVHEERSKPKAPIGEK